jgi:hypothetical protein
MHIARGDLLTKKTEKSPRGQFVRKIGSWRSWQEVLKRESRALGTSWNSLGNLLPRLLSGVLKSPAKVP